MGGFLHLLHPQTSPAPRAEHGAWLHRHASQGAASFCSNQSKARTYRRTSYIHIVLQGAPGHRGSFSSRALARGHVCQGSALSGSVSGSLRPASETFGRTKGLRGGELLLLRSPTGGESLGGEFPFPIGPCRAMLHGTHVCPVTKGTRRCQPLFAGRGNGGDAGDLGGVIRPGLEVLQGEERGVVHADGVGLDGLVDGFLEGLLLQLHEDAVCLLPLGLPLLRCLPPGRKAAIRGLWGGNEEEKRGWGLRGLSRDPSPSNHWYVPCTAGCA